jgi:hypothetical protein
VVSFTPLPLYPRGESPGTRCIGGWVGPRTGANEVERRKMLHLQGLELRPVSRIAHSQSLYRLHCRGRRMRTVHRNSGLRILAPAPQCCGLLEHEEVAEFPHRWADRHLLWAPLCLCVHAGAQVAYLTLQPPAAGNTTQRMWKSDMFAEGLRKTTQMLSQDRGRPK